MAAADGETADVVVFNTCAVRENADNRLYGNLSHLVPVKAAHPGMQIAVGGCLAQKDQGDILAKAPWVDVVFGTHNIGSLPVLLERARIEHEAQVEIKEALEVFPSTLPTRRDSAYSAWVSVSVGCNNTCTFCIVPALRGKEKDRRARRHPRRDPGTGRRGRPGDHPARPERQRLRLGVRRPRGLLEAAARVRRGRRTRARALHQPASARLHRRRDRSDGARRRMSCRSCTCRCSRAPTSCSSACGAPTARTATSASSSGCGRPCPRRRSRPTSSSASPARPRRTSSRPCTSCARPDSPAPSPSSTPSGPARPRRRWTTRCRMRSSRSGTSASSTSSTTIAWAENSRQLGRVVDVLIARGRGTQGRPHRAAVRPRPGQPARARGRRSRRSASPRPGDVVTAEITYAAPHHLVADRVLSMRRTGPAMPPTRGRAPPAPGVLLGLPDRSTPDRARRVLAIVGPHRLGQVARWPWRVAHRLEGRAEIVGTDSMQVYVGMDIGTATPTAAERGGRRRITWSTSGTRRTP